MGCQPVATATALAPTARAHCTSRGVSPITHTSVASMSRPRCDADFSHRQAGDVVAIEVIIAEPAADEEVPEAEVAELVLRPGADIAGEEAKDNARPRAQCREQLIHPGQTFPP